MIRWRRGEIETRLSAKQLYVGAVPTAASKFRRGDGTARHSGLKILWGETSVRVGVPLPAQKNSPRRARAV